MKTQPGIMLYFDVRPCLARLTMEEQGRLFNAILNYGEFGAEPDFDYMLGIAWDFIKPRLDRDKERYEEIYLAVSGCAAFHRHGPCGLRCGSDGNGAIGYSGAGADT